ncbi:MAG: HAD family hydrolase [Anaerococcus prevotii]|nr:HAD family hydrolase [Anaerococcus prevotii]
MEEALLYYMVRNVSFKMEPEELYELIRKNVDKKDYPKKFNNIDNQRVNIDLISQDIKRAYEKLYENLHIFEGEKSLEEVRETDYYKEFVSKMLYRYRASEFDPEAEDPYCWMSFLLKNYKAEEVYDLCKRAYASMKKERIRVEEFISLDIESSAGRVSIKYFVGIRPLEEMVNLYQSLEENGIDCYIVSASFIDIVRAFATDPNNNYKMKEDKVLGLRLMKDDEGKILPKFDKDFPISIREGKVEAINKLIKNDRNYGPIMVGGDSDGDFAMLKEFDQTDISLIIHRANSGFIDELRQKAWKRSDRYYCQGRNLLEASFIAKKKSEGYNE